MGGTRIEALKGKKIGVLLGGESSEREVSLKTGKAILAALLRLGYQAVPLDMKGNWSGIIDKSAIDLAFIALHGKWGEDGAVQGLLEILEIPYTGSGVLASSLCMSKLMTKRVLSEAGVVTPDYTLLERGFDSKKDFPGEISVPCVVKPDREGSTIGVSIVYDETDLKKAVSEAFQYDTRIIVEKYIGGREITVGLINGKVLPAIEIIPTSGFYDYASKYTKGATEYVCPAKIDESVLEKAYIATGTAAKVISLKGGARLDFIIDKEGDTYFLEVNTIPGMTETSLLPKAAKATGMSFDDLVENILLDAGTGK